MFDGRVDVRLVAKVCATLGADVLALQEVDVGVPRSGRLDTVALVAEATGMQGFFGRSTRVGAIGSYGNALFVRGEAREVETVRLPRRGRTEPRTLMTARVQVGGVELTVGATHLSIHHDECEAQLAAVLETVGGLPGPRVVLGDLNLPPAEVMGAASAAGFSLADPSEPSFPVHAPTARIDHVLGSGVAFESVTVHPGFAVGDHRPVIVEVEVP